MIQISDPSWACVRLLETIHRRINTWYLTGEIKKKNKNKNKKTKETAKEEKDQGARGPRDSGSLRNVIKGEQQSKSYGRLSRMRLPPPPPCRSRLQIINCKRDGTREYTVPLASNGCNRDKGNDRSTTPYGGLIDADTSTLTGRQTLWSIQSPSRLRPQRNQD